MTQKADQPHIFINSESCRGDRGLLDHGVNWSKSNYSMLRKVMTTVYEAMKSLNMLKLLKRIRLRLENSYKISTRKFNFVPHK